MATAPLRLRARDIDRATVASALDQAYADGQLSFEEHRDRIATARTAKTLGELHGMVADLQLSVDLPEPAPPPQPRRSRIFVIAGATAAVAVIGIVSAALLSGPDDAKAYDEPVAASSPAPTAAIVAPPDVVPIVAEPVVLNTEQGLARFIEQYRTKFGDTMADRVVLFPTSKPPYGSITRQGEPGLKQDYSFRGGFQRTGSSSVRDADAQAVDLATINLPVLAGTLAGAPQSVGLPGAQLSHLSINSWRGTPQIQIHVTDDAGRSGHLTTAFTGEQLELYPHVP